MIRSNVVPPISHINQELSFITLITDALIAPGRIFAITIWLTFMWYIVTIFFLQGSNKTFVKVITSLRSLVLFFNVWSRFYSII